LAGARQRAALVQRNDGDYRPPASLNDYPLPAVHDLPDDIREPSLDLGHTHPHIRHGHLL
jgi:hypothetical protein